MKLCFSKVQNVLYFVILKTIRSFMHIEVTTC